MSAGPDSYVRVTLSETQAARLRDGIRAGNTEFTVWGPRPTLRVLRRYGLITSSENTPSLTDEGKDVARQIKTHPRRRTFYVRQAAGSDA